MWSDAPLHLLSDMENDTLSFLESPGVWIYACFSLKHPKIIYPSQITGDWKWGRVAQFSGYRDGLMNTAVHLRSVYEDSTIKSIKT